jgi:hypothetical protein
VNPAAEPLPAVFAVMLQAHAAAGRLQQIDAEVVRELGMKDVEAFVGLADVYAAKLAERSAPVLESQIEAGALLAADLIVGAWIKAGRPRLEGIKPPAAEPQESAAAEPAPAHAELVGSLGSMVYHRASCTHCARIKPENMVRFGTSQDAEAAGRKPCRACRPDGR